jgi:hypothetical protein
MNRQILNKGPARTRCVTAQVMLSCAAAVIISLLWLSIATAADLFGTVRRNGKPAEGVTVKLARENQPANDPAKSATTDTAGQYIIRGIVPGNYMLICDGKNPLLIDIGSGIHRRDCNL